MFVCENALLLDVYSGKFTGDDGKPFDYYNCTILTGKQVLKLKCDKDSYIALEPYKNDENVRLKVVLEIQQSGKFTKLILKSFDLV